MFKIATTVAVFAFTSSFAVAGSPDNPGQFGRDRSAGVKSFQSDDTMPGASEWGKIASERAGENGDMNRAYKSSVGGDPNPLNDNGGGNDGEGSASIY